MLTRKSWDIHVNGMVFWGTVIKKRTFPVYKPWENPTGFLYRSFRISQSIDHGHGIWKRDWVTSHWVVFYPGLIKRWPTQARPKPWPGSCRLISWPPNVKMAIAPVRRRPRTAESAEILRSRWIQDVDGGKPGVEPELSSLNDHFLNTTGLERCGFFEMI